MLKMPIDKNDTYVKRWLTGLAKKTKHGYPSLLEDWMTFIGLSPTEQINKRMHDNNSEDITVKLFFEDKWKAYKESMESTGIHKDKWIHDRLKVVASFFNRNGLPLALEHGAWKSTQKQEVIEKKEKLNLDDVKRMYAHANLRSKCILLILAQSGFSEIDISELKIESIKGLYEMAVNEHYVIEKPRDKTNHVQATCLSYEFLHDLRELLSEDGNPTKGYIFVSQTRQEIEKKEGMTEDDIKKAKQEAKEKRLSCIDVRRINEAMKDLAEKTFGIDSPKAKEFQTRMLRSFYNSALLRAKIQPQEIKDLMMGHEREGARANYSYDDETIREAYISAFEYLSINGIQSRQDLQTIKQEMKKNQDYLISVITELKADNKGLKQQITDNKNTMDKQIAIWQKQYDEEREGIEERLHLFTSNLNPEEKKKAMDKAKAEYAKTEKGKQYIEQKAEEEKKKKEAETVSKT